ncbi:DUF885 family protein [Pseudoduganella sp. RAF53_2]|uniref:DUF885 family protein n=1 Tax=unclassified Pseudoduganella TaxID=2637179 RepID=UPI003F99C780
MKTLRILILAMLTWALYGTAASIARAQVNGAPDPAKQHTAAQLEVRRLQGELLSAARVVLDTGLRSFNWTSEEAHDYLTQSIGLSEDRAQSELRNAQQRLHGSRP